MSDTDLTWRREPTLLDLRDLERIGDRRAEIEAVEAADEGEAEMRRLLLEVLDEMEEELCMFGRRAPLVREGWRRLAPFESFGRKEPARSPAARLSRRERTILELLAAGGEMAGLELVAASPAVGRGTVYVALRSLADKGLVESRPVNGRGRELPRRLFRATGAAPAAAREAPAW